MRSKDRIKLIKDTCSAHVPDGTCFNCQFLDPLTRYCKYIEFDKKFQAHFPNEELWEGKNVLKVDIFGFNPNNI